MTSVLNGYRDASSELIPRYEAISSSDLYAHVSRYFPTAPSQIIDIGAGTGRDAAWFATQGHQVLAVEPVAEFRETGKRLHPAQNIKWLDDELPKLPKSVARGQSFDLVLLGAVWHHLDPEHRQSAMPVLRTLIDNNGTL
ncbi:MAG: class I SAM-dependent methyltransferase, partial [Cohaesibacteraceae bacterium]|nr:class I SAM-dependent methyltransferase [Cohaesibacteraceae bacterium]